MTQVFAVTNQSLPAAPPSYFLPNPVAQPNGVPVPLGMSQWVLAIDQTNVPAASSYSFAVQYLVSGQWQDDASATFSGGPIPVKAGGSTFINTLSSGIGSRDSNGNMIGAYPSGARVRVDSIDPTWVFPSITLTLT